MSNRLPSRLPSCLPSRRTFLSGLLAAAAVPALATRAHAQVSPSSVAPARIVFTNLGSATIVAVWMDFAGAEVIYSSIAPGQSVTQDTFVGHIWRFRRGPGGPIVTQWAVDRPVATLTIGDGGFNVY